jgi:hypothetical protein
MSTETIAPAPVPKSPALVNGLLKWPEDDRLALAKLLLDSVDEGFTSLEEAETRDRDLIRSRVEAYERGETQALDWRESLAKLEAELRAEFPQ